ncbi:MAG: sensor histidine kinase [Paracoccaceae bacterium]
MISDGDLASTPQVGMATRAGAVLGAGRPTNQEIIAQQIRAITDLTPAMMTGNVINALAVLLLLVQTGSLSTFGAVWAGALIGSSLFFLYGAWSKRGIPFPQEMSERTQRKVIIFAAFFGALWSVQGLFILPDAPLIVKAFCLVLAGGVIAGSSIALYPIPAAAFWCAGLIGVSHLIGFTLTGGPLVVPFVIVIASFFIVITRSIWRHEKVFVSEFRTRRELDMKNQHIQQLLDEAREDSSEQRRTLKAQQADVEKMEAVGRLTAGIAHDFNNLLAVVMGNIELAQMENRNASLDELLIEARTATLRGAKLTNQLVSFGRKATLAPRIIDINEVLRAMTPSLRNILPDTAKLELDLGIGQYFCNLDVLPFESAMRSLVLNAKDAIETQGRITIGTCLSDPIESDTPDTSNRIYVYVTDTGPGIDADILEKVFEPFFTTKEVGKGSGLGLAMVYGFAKQSGGTARIASEKGLGTTVVLSFALIAVDTPSTDIGQIRSGT